MINKEKYKENCDFINVSVIYSCHTDPFCCSVKKDIDKLFALGKIEYIW